jgi:hypothetical protein
MFPPPIYLSIHVTTKEKGQEEEKKKEVKGCCVCGQAEDWALCVHLSNRLHIKYWQ